ncbi:TPA: uL30 family ribosomal protein [archaeon]|uniref:UL30 family ribosomal protein n=1 Tax=Candidatus Naiadarchaeum limnaeum TaxID=2756139 RepID=A0A832XJF0_9ARCH|nr:uL30 family ribosomal protein [Candidatus Naiadarchaeum limnaeum]
MTKLALIRVRGKVKVNPGVKDTLEYLGLKTVNSCTVVDDTPTYRGMIRKVNDYITWGEISEDIVKALVEKRAEGDKKIFRLHPPKKGWDRKGIKKAVKQGGALGYRGTEINNLIKRML